MQLDAEVVRQGVAAVLGDEHKGRYYVAVVNGTIVGQLMITYEWSDWRNGMFWWIQSVYVTPDFRRRGIYRTMYQQVKDLAASEPGVCGFRLYVEHENTRAQKTYEDLGMSAAPYRMYEELKDGVKYHA